MPGSLRLTRAQLAVVLEHARACAPEEACGVLAGDKNGSVRHVFTMNNSAGSSTFYLMDSREQFRVFDQIEKEGLELVAIFHSHPHSPAFPSGRDTELAFYTDSLYLIVSLMDNKSDCRVFKIVDGKVEEVEMIIVDRQQTE